MVVGHQQLDDSGRRWWQQVRRQPVVASVSLLVAAHVERGGEGRWQKVRGVVWVRFAYQNSEGNYGSSVVVSWWYCGALVGLF